MKPDHFTDLQNTIERFAHGVPAGEDAAARTAFDRLKAGLNAGAIRAAERDAQGNWRVNQWVKAGILLGFRLGKVVPVASDGPIPFFDKDTYPVQRLTVDAGVRVVPVVPPFGTVVTWAAAVCMPPMYVNVGAYVDEGTLIDSHALVGSCAQVGKAVHLRRGRSWESIGAGRCIAGDHRRRRHGRWQLRGLRRDHRSRRCPRRGHDPHRLDAPLRPGAGPYLSPRGDRPLEVPAGGCCAGQSCAAVGRGIAAGPVLYAPVIVKYRDEKTDLSTRLEELLR